MIEYDYNSILERIVSVSLDALNEGEHTFISNVYEQHILNKRNLTDKQKECVLKINRKLVNRN